jgi:DegV family protein with EDD domain
MVRIITDSTSDLGRAHGEELGIDILPLTVHFGQESFRDGVDISIPEFYAKLTSSNTLPSTSQVNPSDFETLFRQYTADGDEVLCLLISSDLSGTCQSALMARDMVGSENIHIVDTRSVTFALGLLVEEAVRLRDSGKTAAEIADVITGLSRRLCLVAAVSTLKYLKMGGRLSATSAVVGGLLNINPIVSVQNGKVEAIGKTRGRKAAFQFMLKYLQQNPADPGYPVAFGHSNDPEALSACMEFFSAYVDTKSCVVGDIGSIVGTHAGPGATGIAYFAAE